MDTKPVLVDIAIGNSTVSLAITDTSSLVDTLGNIRDVREVSRIDDTLVIVRSCGQETEKGIIDAIQRIYEPHIRQVAA